MVASELRVRLLDGQPLPLPGFLLESRQQVQRERRPLRRRQMPTMQVVTHDPLRRRHPTRLGGEVDLLGTGRNHAPVDTVTLTDDETRMVASVEAEFGVSRQRATEIVLAGTRGRWADDVVDAPDTTDD